MNRSSTLSGGSITWRTAAAAAVVFALAGPVLAQPGESGGDEEAIEAHALEAAKAWDASSDRATDRLSSRDALDTQGRPYDVYRMGVEADRPYVTWLLPTRFGPTLFAYGDGELRGRGMSHLVWTATGDSAHVVVSTTTARDVGPYTLLTRPVPLIAPGEIVRGTLGDADPRIEAIARTFDVYAVRCAEGDRVHARVRSNDVDAKVWATGFQGMRVNDETEMFTVLEASATAADDGFVLLYVSTIGDYTSGVYTLELLDD